MREPLSNTPLLKERLGLDLKEFELDEFMVGRQVAELGEDRARFVFAAVVEEPSGRERHPDHADEEDEGGDELDADRDEPGGVGLGIGCCAADVVAAALEES